MKIAVSSAVARAAGSNAGSRTKTIVAVSRNTARAEGPAGAAQGGGIWDGVDITGPAVLTGVSR